MTSKKHMEYSTICVQNKYQGDELNVKYKIKRQGSTI